MTMNITRSVVGVVGLAVLVVVVVAGCGLKTVDRCDGESGDCLALEVQGSVGNVDAVELSFSGAVPSRTVTALPSKRPTPLPIAIGIALPAGATGTLSIGAAVLLDGKVVGLGMTSVDVTPGGHLRAVLLVTPAGANADAALADQGLSDGAAPDQAQAQTDGPIPDQATVADALIPPVDFAHDAGIVTTCTVDAQCGGNGHCVVTQAGTKVCSALLCAAICEVASDDGVLCIPATFGTDPKNECAVDVASCKQASCNGKTGASGCDAADNVSCGPSSCIDPSKESNPICVGGACVATTKICGAYLCKGSACTTSCGDDSSCGAAYYCHASGACLPQKVRGDACNLATDCKFFGCRECASAGCVDGFCCDTACGGACDACSVASGASANGTCSIAAAGSPGSPTCMPYACNGTSNACPTQCISDSTCAPGFHCATTANPPQCLPWVGQASGTTQGLFGIWGSGANDVFAVGDPGIILHTKDGGAVWSSQTSGASWRLQGVWGSSSADVYAVGWSPNILRTSDGGSTWKTELTTAGQLNDVWGSSSTDVYAVGQMGTILHSNGGGSWVAQNSGTTQFLTGVWGSSSTDVYVVGGSGLILHSGGNGSWVAQPSGVTITTLQSVGGSSAGDVYVVGDSGIMLHTSNGGLTWTKQTPPTGNFITAVCGRSGGEVFAVGGGGTVIRTTNGGTTWTSQPSSTTRDLYGLWCGPGVAFAAGAGGTIVYH